MSLGPQEKPMSPALVPPGFPHTQEGAGESHIAPRVVHEPARGTDPPKYHQPVQHPQQIPYALLSIWFRSRARHCFLTPPASRSELGVP